MPQFSARILSVSDIAKSNASRLRKSPSLIMPGRSRAHAHVRPALPCQTHSRRIISLHRKSAGKPLSVKHPVSVIYKEASQRTYHWPSQIWPGVIINVRDALCSVLCALSLRARGRIVNRYRMSILELLAKASSSVCDARKAVK